MVLIIKEEFTEFRVGNFETSSLAELEGKAVNLGERLRTKTWSRNKQNQEGEAGMVMREFADAALLGFCLADRS